MKIYHLRTKEDGTKSFEIRCSEVPYHVLLRSIRRIAGAVVINAVHNPMNDDTNMSITYKDVTITIETPFSDYIINCTSCSEAFDEFVTLLSNYHVRWWERFF